MKIPQHLDGLSKRDLIRHIISLELNNEELLKRIEKLERRLLAYENAHTPPSKTKEKHYPKRETGVARGAPKGHKGTTRKTPEPTESKILHLDFCPDCHSSLGKPKRIEKRIIEEIPNPQPLRVIEFLISHYHCPCCNKEIIPTDSELPDKGNLGNNLLAEIAHLRYADRLPMRKISASLNRQYEGINLSPASIYNALGRVTDKLSPIYNQIKEEIPKSERSHADETGAKLDGKKHWFWVFMTKIFVLFVLSKRRESKVIKDIMGENYNGIMTVDGYPSYPAIIKKIQRCWAHLLREAKFLAQKYDGQAKVLYNSLCKIYEKLNVAVQKKSMGVRMKWHKKLIKEMQADINLANGHTELRKFAGTMKNAKEQWFTALLYPETELTNNRAERELREFVVQRKIFGSFRSEGGIRITDTIMSVLATWRIQGLNTASMLRVTLSS